MTRNLRGQSHIPLLFLAGAMLFLCSCDTRTARDIAGRLFPKPKRGPGIFAHPTDAWHFESMGFGGGRPWRGVAAGGTNWLLYNDFSGVFRSGDEGATWQPANIGFRAGKVYDIASVTDKEGRQAFLAGGDSGIYRSADGGGTWRRTGWLKGRKAIKQFACITAFAVNREEPFKIAAIEGTADVLGARQKPLRRIWLSTDVGVTWKRVTISSAERGGRLDDVCWLRDSIYALVNRSELHHSSDFGRSWSKVVMNIHSSNILSLASFRGRLYAATAPRRAGEKWQDVVYSSVSGRMWKQHVIPRKWNKMPELPCALETTRKGISFQRAGRISASRDGIRWHIMLDGRPKVKPAPWQPPGVRLTPRYARLNEAGLWLFGERHVYRFNPKTKIASPVTCAPSGDGSRNRRINNSFVTDAVVHNNALFPVWRGYYPAVKLDLARGTWLPISWKGINTENCSLTAVCKAPEKWQVVFSFKNWARPTNGFFSVVRSRDTRGEFFRVCSGLPESGAVRSIVYSQGEFLAAGEFPGIYCSSDGLAWQSFTDGMDNARAARTGWMVFGNNDGVFADGPGEDALHYLIKKPTGQGGWANDRWFRLGTRLAGVGDIAVRFTGHALLFAPMVERRKPGVLTGTGDDYKWLWRRTQFIRARTGRFFICAHDTNAVYFTATGIEDGPRAMIYSSNGGDTWEKETFSDAYAKERLLLTTGTFRGKPAAFFGGQSGLLVATPKQDE